MMKNNFTKNSTEQGDSLDEKTLAGSEDRQSTLSEQQSHREPREDWRLICPPENWREPLPIDLGELRLLEILSQRLNLVITRDDKRKKLYLGTAYGLIDGGHDGSAMSPNDVDQPKQHPPSAGTRRLCTR